MSDMIVWAILVLGVANAALLVLVLVRSSSSAEEGAPLRDELRAGREETNQAARESREELAASLKAANETLSASLSSLGEIQRAQLDGLNTQLKQFTESNVASLDQIRTTVDARVKELQEGNERKLEEMRKTVDEKLHDTLEKRLGESFKLVSDRLEAVQRGLGEMQNLATGVGDLKRVLTNVKTRGTWGEIQLGSLLEQILAPGQYDKNVRTKEDSLESVEFAIRLPGSKDEPSACVWLPIDSKFPQEDYLRLQEAAESGDPEATQKAADALARAVKVAAQDISGKYLCPPRTTDFAIMFLATEGLYAEVLRHPSLVDELRQRYRIEVAGPTTLAALLNSVRIVFQTIAIEQRAGEVWQVLAAVKTEFGKFGEVLDKVKRQLGTAANTIDAANVRTRAMERKLRSVESLPAEEASGILELPAVFAENAGSEDDEEPSGPAPLESEESAG